jgi:hypothetical protein
LFSNTSYTSKIGIAHLEASLAGGEIEMPEVRISAADISEFVLAGGEITRMRSDKTLLELHGAPLIVRASNAVLLTNFERAEPPRAMYHKRVFSFAFRAVVA